MAVSEQVQSPGPNVHRPKSTGPRYYGVRTTIVVPILRFLRVDCLGYITQSGGIIMRGTRGNQREPSLVQNIGEAWLEALPSGNRYIRLRAGSRWSTHKNQNYQTIVPYRVPTCVFSCNCTCSKYCNCAPGNAVTSRLPSGTITTWMNRWGSGGLRPFIWWVLRVCFSLEKGVFLFCFWAGELSRFESPIHPLCYRNCVSVPMMTYGQLCDTNSKWRSSIDTWYTGLEKLKLRYYAMSI